MAELIITLFVMAGAWRMFQKMGRQGWEAIIPFYNLYVLFQALYGRGWRFLMFLIPIYNIYLAFRVGIDLAQCFHYGVGYGIGLTLLPVVFIPLTGFGNAVFGDGSKASTGDDPISRTLDEVSSKINSGGAASSDHQEEKRQQEILRMLRELETLRNAGVLTEEEFQEKKAAILQKL